MLFSFMREKSLFQRERKQKESAGKLKAAESFQELSNLYNAFLFSKHV